MFSLNVCHVLCEVEGSCGIICLGGRYMMALDARWRTTYKSGGHSFPEGQSRNTPRENFKIQSGPYIGDKLRNDLIHRKEQEIYGKG
jgi:hypothetical protein